MNIERHEPYNTSAAATPFEIPYHCNPLSIERIVAEGSRLQMPTQQSVFPNSYSNMSAFYSRNSSSINLSDQFCHRANWNAERLHPDKGAPVDLKLHTTNSSSLLDAFAPRPPQIFPYDHPLTGYDILCGRHKLAFNHVGNRRFRVTISIFLPRYLKTPSRLDRSVIILEIIETIRNAGGHFLKEHKTSEGKRQWIEISDKEVRNKVGHALRDAAAVAQAESKRQHHYQSKKIQEPILETKLDEHQDDGIQQQKQRQLQLQMHMKSNKKNVTFSKNGKNDSSHLDDFPLFGGTDYFTDNNRIDSEPRKRAATAA